MKTRFRFLSALMALLTVLLFQAEGLSASACDGEMGAMSAEQMADMNSGTTPEKQSNEHGPQSPACPMVVASVCASAVALAPTSTTPAPLTLDRAPALSSADHAKDLLLANALLRPPRA